MPPRHREIDHSGDIGIEAWGDSTIEVVAGATQALFGLMTWSPVLPAVERPLEVHAVRDGDALLDWLGAVILSAARHAEVYGDVEIAHADDRSVRGVIRGEAVDPGRHEPRFDVKAATYHGYVYERTHEGFHARVILDL